MAKLTFVVAHHETLQDLNVAGNLLSAPEHSGPQQDLFTQKLVSAAKLVTPLFLSSASWWDVT